MEDQRVGSENGLGYQCFGLASGLPFYLVKEVIGLGQSEGGCHAVHTVSRVDGAGPLLRYAGWQWASQLCRLAMCLLWERPGPVDPEESARKALTARPSTLKGCFWLKSTPGGWAGPCA